VHIKKVAAATCSPLRRSVLDLRGARLPEDLRSGVEDLCRATAR